MQIKFERIELYQNNEKAAVNLCGMGLSSRGWGTAEFAGVEERWAHQKVYLLQKGDLNEKPQKF